MASNELKRRVLGIKVARCIIIVRTHADIHAASDMVRKNVQPGDRCYMECDLDTTRTRGGAVQPARSLPWTLYAKLGVERPNVQTILTHGM